jgi:Ca-activated chloride channel family protein
VFQVIERGTRDFLSSLKPEDEYFLMTFDEKIRMRREFGATSAAPGLNDLRFGDRTRLFEALGAALLQLQQAHYPRRALFLVSDGVNTAGGGDLSDAIREAQRAKALVYALVVEKRDTDLNTLRTLSESTGGTYFVLHDEFPRLQAAYEKISADLAHRFTLYYRSTSDYSRVQKPQIRLQMKNPRWRARYQRAYFAGEAPH